jgi:hypothetical protein
LPLPDEQLKQLGWALDSLKARAGKYVLYRDYYQGTHELMIDADRRKTLFGRMFAELHMNLCSPVVDSLVDRLQISGFSDSSTQPDGKKNAEVQDAFDLWKRNRMPRRAGQLHLEAVSGGDAYLIVWPNRKGEATFYPQKGHEVAVDYDPDEQGKVTRAAKWFERDGKYRLNLYYEDRIEKYAADKKHKGTADEKNKASDYSVKPDQFEKWRDEGEAWPIPNEYGVVPVFHFANNADLGEYGVSELADAIDVQRMVNWFAFQTLIGVEFHAMLQRYATGIEIEVDPVTGQAKDDNFLSGYEKVWMLPEGATVGVLPSGDVNALSELVNKGATWMALTTQTPVHYFQMTANLVSGEAQKTAEQKLDSKVLDRQISFGDSWAKAMALALRIERGMRADGLVLDCNFKDTKPRNELEFWTNAQTKTMLGVSNRQVLREAGYTDDQIDAFQEEKQAEMSPDDVALQQAEGGIPAGDEFSQSASIMAQRLQGGTSTNGGQTAAQ